MYIDLERQQQQLQIHIFPKKTTNILSEIN